MTARIPKLTRAALTIALLAGCALAASSAEVVVLKDGFVIQGNVQKEVTTIYDKASGRMIPIIKGNGFDMIDQGPNVIIFSSHNRQPGAVSPDTKVRPDYRAFTTKIPGQKNSLPLPPLGNVLKMGEFNEKWYRTLTVAVPGAAPEVIDQQITHMDPYYIFIWSATHRWRLAYRTTEWDPKLVRKLLMMHPDIAEPDKKCDPMKRVILAKFLLDAGWLQMAKDEVDRLNADFSGPMANDAKTAYEKLLKEIDEATAELVAREAELSLAAGRYNYTRDLLAAFPEKNATAQQKARIAKVTAEFKTSMERYENGRRLLRSVIADVTGQRSTDALVAAGGGLACTTWQAPKEATLRALDLAAAAGRVYAELHPDSAIRIETFVTLAAQAERERAAGREPTKKPEELLATAVSGWARGKNGATPNPDDAWKMWKARELILTYQRTESLNDRRAMLAQFQKTPVLTVEELAQMISLLPPADPDDLQNRTGKPILVRNKDVGAFRRTTLPAPGHATGLDYLVRLPPEYHHGRAYPVLIVLTHAGLNPEDILAPLINEADKNGYILVVPEWNNAFVKNGWQWDGADHVWVTAALRDAVRHFTVDNDRVFMIGIGDGANMAMDVGMSHPDLFAGVIPVGPMFRWQDLFIEYWRNAQKLPFFIVSGEMIGDGVKSLRSLYEMWMPRGYPAMWSVYKGRAIEWYAAETPVLFDWMNRKTRASPVAALNLGNTPAARQAWQMMRETDNHFYWLQADSIVVGKNGGAIVPARIQGDIRGNNVIDVNCFHVNQLTIWLSSEMIDWTQPVRVRINENTPPKYPFAGKKIEPSLEIMLEDYYNRGDRRMLFLNKLEFTIRGS
jgi:hypothetical protein